MANIENTNGEDRRTAVRDALAQLAKRCRQTGTSPGDEEVTAILSLFGVKPFKPINTGADERSVLDNKRACVRGAIQRIPSLDEIE